MLVRIDPADRAPIFEQISVSVRRAIAAGDISAGERLPAARALADSLDVNVHTVLRAYQVLRDEGLIELRRGRGAVIADHAQPQAEVADALDRLVGIARRFGVGQEELCAGIYERYDR